jgi:ABC-type iron transport system FetAB permease component
MSESSSLLNTGLALGLMPQAARSLVARPVASEALMPALDHTRTVGTVTLPWIIAGKGPDRTDKTRGHHGRHRQAAAS